MKFNGLIISVGRKTLLTRQVSPGKDALCRSAFAERAGES